MSRSGNDILQSLGLPTWPDEMRIRLECGWVDAGEELSLSDEDDFYRFINVCPACQGKQVTKSGAYGHCTALCFACKGTGRAYPSYPVVQRGRYKRLDVPSWMTWDEEDQDGSLGSPRAPEISPVFGRDGFYLDRKENRTWVEVKGKAYDWRDAKQFRYVLETCHPARLPTVRVVAALRLLKREGMLKGELLEQLRIYDIWSELRDIRLGVNRWLIAPRWGTKEN